MYTKNVINWSSTEETLDMSPPPFPIDAVITYVDINDSNFRSQLKDKNQQKNLSRFESNQEIIYNLRSLEKHMGFIRTIYLLISDFQQIPTFLVASHYQLRIVRHSDIIPSSILPTFNSTVIENFIHKIPNLSEHFLYINDDWIVLKPRQWYHFFTPQGLPIHSIDRTVYSNREIYWKKVKKIENHHRPIKMNH